ncbi:hypothetical protein K439DRAFT_1635146 [Ramaria rubella]|nr:hypothetical protein K439DRAFT_1635146 [Ramaria rubella]
MFRDVDAQVESLLMLEAAGHGLRYPYISENRNSKFLVHYRLVPGKAISPPLLPCIMDRSTTSRKFADSDNNKRDPNG